MVRLVLWSLWYRLVDFIRSHRMKYQLLNELWVIQHDLGSIACKLELLDMDLSSISMRTNWLLDDTGQLVTNSIERNIEKLDVPTVTEAEAVRALDEALTDIESVEGEYEGIVGAPL